MLTIHRAAIAMAIAATALPAHAASTYYNSVATFTAAAGSLAGFEGFNDVRSVAPSHDYGPFTIAETNGVNLVVTTGANSFFTAATVEGSGSIWFDDNDNSLAVFTFDAPITAFGIWTAVSDGGTMSVSGSFGATSFGLASREPTFWGVISTTAFTTVTFDMSGGPNVGFDALRYGTASQGPVIPEPATWALLIAGFGMVGATVRRRRAATA